MFWRNGSTEGNHGTDARFLRCRRPKTGWRCSSMGVWVTELSGCFSSHDLASAHRPPNSLSPTVDDDQNAPQLLLLPPLLKLQRPDINQGERGNAVAAV